MDYGAEVLSNKCGCPSRAQAHWLGAGLVYGGHVPCQRFGWVFL